MLDNTQGHNRHSLRLTATAKRLIDDLKEARAGNDKEQIREAFEALIGGDDLGDPDIKTNDIHEAFEDMLEDLADDDEGDVAYERARECMSNGDQEDAAQALAEAIWKEPSYKKTPLYKKLKPLVAKYLEKLEEEEAESLYDQIWDMLKKRPLTPELISESSALFERLVQLDPDYEDSPISRRLQRFLPEKGLKVLPAKQQEERSPALRPTSQDTGLGEQLRQLRREMGLSQETLAALLKVTKLTVLRWETGSHPPAKRHIGEVKLLLDLYNSSGNNPQARQELANLCEDAAARRPKDGRLIAWASDLRRRS